MSEPADDKLSLAMAIGRLEGKVGEMNHNINGASMKLDGLMREVVALGPLAADITDLKTRVKALEETDNRQAGAAGVVQAILKSPMIGWLVGAAISAWAIFTGKVHL